MLVGAYGQVLRIRGGVVVDIYGDGDAGPSGDGGPATLATFGQVLAVASGGTSDVFVAKSADKRVRRIEGKTGIVSTVAGAIEPPRLGAFSDARLPTPRDLAPLSSDAAESSYLIASGPSGRLLLADFEEEAVLLVAGEPRGIPIDDASPVPARRVERLSARGIVVDPTTETRSSRGRRRARCSS